MCVCVPLRIQTKLYVLCVVVVITKLQDEEKVFDVSFVGRNIFVAFDGAWFPSKCLYSDESVSEFVASDQVGFQFSRAQFQDNVRENHVSWLVLS